MNGSSHPEPTLIFYCEPCRDKHSLGDGDGLHSDFHALATCCCCDGSATLLRLTEGEETTVFLAYASPFDAPWRVKLHAKVDDEHKGGSTE